MGAFLATTIPNRASLLSHSRVGTISGGTGATAEKAVPLYADNDMILRWRRRIKSQSWRTRLTQGASRTGVSKNRPRLQVQAGLRVATQPEDKLRLCVALRGARADLVLFLLFWNGPLHGVVS